MARTLTLQVLTSKNMKDRDEATIGGGSLCIVLLQAEILVAQWVYVVF